MDELRPVKFVDGGGKVVTAKSFELEFAEYEPAQLLDYDNPWLLDEGENTGPPST